MRGIDFCQDLLCLKRNLDKDEEDFLLVKKLAKDQRKKIEKKR